jgi:hypothetical protein
VTMDTYIPFGFKLGKDNHLIGTASLKERQTRAALGEGAIALFGLLGVDDVALALICSSADPVAALAQFQEGAK